MPSADADAPCDRPNLSKDYLAGTADEDWIPLQGPEFYAEHDIDLRLGCEVTAIDTAARQVHLGTGERLDYRSEEHTSELQSLMRISYAAFCLKQKKQHHTIPLPTYYY